MLPVDLLSGLISFLFLFSSALGGRGAAPDRDFLSPEGALRPSKLGPARLNFKVIEALSPRTKRVFKTNPFILQSNGPLDDHGDHSHSHQPEEVLQGHQLILCKQEECRHLWIRQVFYNDPGPGFQLLSTRLQQGPLNATHVSKLFADLIDFVNYAHREQVSLAPIGLDNILVGPEGEGFRLVGLRYSDSWLNEHPPGNCRILHELFANVMGLCNLCRDELDSKLRDDIPADL